MESTLGWRSSIKSFFEISDAHYLLAHENTDVCAHLVVSSLFKVLREIYFVLIYTLPSRKYPDSFEFSCESVVREICLQISKSVFMKTFLSISSNFFLKFFWPLILSMCKRTL